MRVARLLRCQGSAACLIATIWPPESHLRTSQDKVENELWAKCARRALAGFGSPKSCRSAAKECTFPPYKTPFKATSKCKDHALVVPGWHFGEAHRIMWARVKGRTENALLRLPLAAYM